MGISQRKTILFFLVIFSVMFSFSHCYGDNDYGNLLYNGDFEIINDDNSSIPDGWDTVEYFEGRGFSRFEMTDDEQGDHGSIALIQNYGKNDARFVQYVDVDPDTVYRLSGYIRTDGVLNGRGANLSIEGLYAFSESVYGTNDWKYIEYYGETGPDQTYVGVYVRLGGYGGESIGTACFDNIRLEAVDEIPDNVIAARWYTEDSEYYGDDEDYDGNDQNDQKTKSSEPLVSFWVVLVAIGLLWAAVFTGIIYFYRDGHRLQGYLMPGPYIPCIAFIVLALLFRMVISLMVEGYDVDVTCFTSWGKTMAYFGPTRFYQSAGMIDYRFERKPGVFCGNLIEHLRYLMLHDHHCRDLCTVRNVHENIPVIHLYGKAVTDIDECSARAGENDICTVDNDSCRIRKNAARAVHSASETCYLSYCSRIVDMSAVIGYFLHETGDKACKTAVVITYFTVGSFS